HEVSPAAAPDQQLLQPTVRFDDTKATDTREKFYKELLAKETCAEDANWDEREAIRIAVVIGHTHQPRIVVGTGNDGYTLMDCGSWVNQSQASANPQDIFWNSQIGVLTGNECAVLQIGT